jgi:hypothetical protein
MTYLISFFILANGAITQVTTVHGSQQTCEQAKAKLMKEVKEYKLVAVCLDR